MTRTAFALMPARCDFQRAITSLTGAETYDGNRVLLRLWEPGLLPRLHADARPPGPHRRDDRLPPDAARWRVQGDGKSVADQHSREGRLDDERPAALCAPLW